MENPRWKVDHIQFARLLCEIVAVRPYSEFKDLVRELARSMDLKHEQISELFDRAEAAWERAKKTVELPEVICGNCGSDNVEYAVWRNPNTKEVGDLFGSWGESDSSFCNDCDGHGTLIAIEVQATKEQFVELWKKFKAGQEKP